MSEKLWRCTECGKWSHAKRKPSRHERRVNDDLGTDEPETVIRAVEGWDPETGPELVGWIVPCGPFEAWVASPVDEGQEARA